MAKTPYDLDRNPANFQPLTPLGFWLARRIAQDMF
jgi:hypothetical protein